MKSLQDFKTEKENFLENHPISKGEAWGTKFREHLLTRIKKADPTGQIALYMKRGGYLDEKTYNRLIETLKEVQVPMYLRKVFKLEEAAFENTITNFTALNVPADDFHTFLNGIDGHVEDLLSSKLENASGVKFHLTMKCLYKSSRQRW